MMRSDQSRYKGLWEIDLVAFTQLMRTVGTDMPTTLIRVFDEERQDWFVWQGYGKPPKHIRAKVEQLKKPPKTTPPS
jgi:hypothetical protein